MDTQTVLQALQQLRCPFIAREEQLHRLVAECLTNSHIPYIHEAKLAPHCRIDFLVDGIGIEVKKDKPNQKELLAQLHRYAACDAIEALIYIAPYAMKLPASINQKKISSIHLHALWGVALS